MHWPACQDRPELKWEGPSQGAVGTKANPSKPKGAKLEQEPPCPEGEPLERNKLLKPMFSNVPQLFSFVFLCFHCLSFVFQLFSNGFPMDWVVHLRFSLVFHCLPMLSNAFHCFPFVFSIVFPNGFQWLSFVLQWFSHGFHWFPFGSQWFFNGFQLSSFVFQLFPNGFHWFSIVFQWFPIVFLRVSLVFQWI